MKQYERISDTLGEEITMKQYEKMLEVMKEQGFRLSASQLKALGFSNYHSNSAVREAIKEDIPTFQEYSEQLQAEARAKAELAKYSFEEAIKRAL